MAHVICQQHHVVLRCRRKHKMAGLDYFFPNPFFSHNFIDSATLFGFHPRKDVAPQPLHHRIVYFERLGSRTRCHTTSQPHGRCHPDLIQSEVFQRPISSSTLSKPERPHIPTFKKLRTFTYAIGRSPQFFLAICIVIPFGSNVAYAYSLLMNASPKKYTQKGVRTGSTVLNLTEPALLQQV